MAAPAFERKLCRPGELAARVAQLPRPLVFIPHRGHVTYLDAARALGTSLVVGVNSDDSVRRQGKDDDRPINRLEDRMALLAALESVALVVDFDTGTPLDLILAVRPDVPVKGGDWTPDAIVGAREVAAWGGRVHSIPFQHQTSTTALLERIRT